MNRVFLNYADAAAYLRLPVNTLYSLVSRKQIPHHRLGPRLVRFRLADLNAWLEARAVSPERSRDSSVEVA